MSPIITLSFDSALLERLLAPYKSHCRYIRDLTLQYPSNRRPPHPDDRASWITIEGRCGISGSCYINDTGHLNAVEFNISYNQLLYAGLTASVQHSLIAELQHWSLEDWWSRQLPDVLIIDYHARFRRPMCPRAFHGRFEIRQVVPKRHKHLVLLHTACQMGDDNGGSSDADVVIALVHV